MFSVHGPVIGDCRKKNGGTTGATVDQEIYSTHSSVDGGRLIRNENEHQKVRNVAHTRQRAKMSDLDEMLSIIATILRYLFENMLQMKDRRDGSTATSLLTVHFKL